jgi:hypothetical protein
MSELNVYEAQRGQGWTGVDLSATPDEPVAPVVETSAEPSADAPVADAPPTEPITPEPVLDVPQPTRGERRLAQLQEQIQASLVARRAAQAELDALEAAAATRRSELAALGQPTHPAPVAPSGNGAPLRSQYADESTYLAAVASWSGEQAVDRALAKQKAAEQAERILSRHQAGESAYADYRQVVTNPDFEPHDFLRPVLADFVRDSEMAPHVLYHLGTNAEAFAELQDLNANGAKRYLARLGEALRQAQAPAATAGAPRVAPRTLPPVTAHVPPVRPLSGGGTGPVGNNATEIANQRGSFADYVKARNAEEGRR